MKKSHGIVSLKKAAKLLNKHAPEGESLAYINPTEGRILKAHGGSGIMTLAGVPSYDWWETVKNIGKYVAPIALDWFSSPADAGEPDDIEDLRETDFTYSSGTEYEDPYYQTRTLDVPPKQVWSDIATGAKKWAIDRYKDPKNIMTDVGAVGTTIWGIYDDYRKGKIDKEKFDQEIAQEAAYQAEVQANLGQFSVGDIPQEEDIAQFTEATGIPEMKTNPWAAEGGRIGAFNGGIQGLMPQQGPAGFMPQQGMMPQQGLMPQRRMGYSHGDIVDQELETWKRPSTLERDVDVLNPAEMGSKEKLVQQKVQEGYEMLLEMRSKGMLDHDLSPNELYATALRNVQSNYLRDPNFAQGGRIGYFNGGIQGLMPQQGIMPQQGFMPQRRMGYATQGFVGSTPEEGDIGFEEEIIHPGTLDEGNIGMPGQATTEFEHEGALVEDDSLFQKIVEITSRIASPPINPLYVYNIMKKGGLGIMEAIEIVKNKMGGEVTEEVTENKPPEWADDFLEKLNTGEIELPKQNYENEMMPFNVAQGGRIGVQGGGIMPLLDLGGMEKDYRQEGGFVPIGRREKADDVPARLSKNEFVFTADAVKAAGGGDIDEGAQRMYNVMKNLEAGGDISQQTQGLG